MKSSGSVVSLALLLLFLQAIQSTQLTAQEPEIESALKKAGAKTEIYKSTQNAGGEKVDLNIYIFNPADHKATDNRPAIVFFFGGGWNAGKPSQFAEHCKYLASRGMVAMTADYRVASRHKTKAVKCVNDAKSAVRWMRQNAQRLGINPDKIASGGGSAGGHLAACTGVVANHEDPNDDATISSVPNAMVLFNPALVLAKVNEADENSSQSNELSKMREKKLKAMESRVGAKPISVSPYHNVKQGAPPTIIFHGKADKTVPYRTAELFDLAMRKAGNHCQLVGYEKQGHGFFNHGRKKGKYDETVKEMDKFLVANGFLAEPEDKQKSSK